MRGPKMKIRRIKIIQFLIVMFLLSLSLSAWAEEQTPIPAGEQPLAQDVEQPAPQAEQPAVPQTEEPAVIGEEPPIGEGETIVGEPYDGIEPEGEHFYHYPKIKPQYSLWGGYRAIKLQGSERAAEFESLKDSPSLGALIIAFPFPVRLHLEGDFLTDQDYFADFRFAYKDLVQVRFLGRSFIHNLDNVRFSDLDTATLQRDPADERYDLRTQIYKEFLRFKVPNYPLHFFAELNQVAKNGEIQTRFDKRINSPVPLRRTSQEMPVDWDTTEAKFGVNGHLGPAEVEISHSEKRFESGSKNFLFEPNFDPSDTLVGLHHLVPDFKGSINELKLHTSYTGRLVASATFMTNDRENEFSNAEADYFLGAGYVRYLATDRLAFVLKYRHKDLDLDNTDISIVNDPRIFYNSSGPPTTVRRSISSRTDTVTGIATYRFSSSLSVEANTSYKHEKREDLTGPTEALSWNLPETTDEKAFGLAATYRPVKGLKLRAKYAHLEIDDPAYNFQPDKADSGSFSASWTPADWVTGFLTYELAKEHRGDYELIGATPAEGRDRDVTRDKLTGTVSFLLGEKVTITPSYAYWHNRIKQDIQDIAPDEQVPYKDIAQSYSLAVDFAPRDRLNLGAEVSHTIAHGNFYSNNDKLGDVSRLRITETIYTLDARYEIRKNLEVGLNYSYTDFDTEENPLNPEDTDGTASIVLVSLTKRWL
jgi:hypothetical protein